MKECIDREAAVAVLLKAKDRSEAYRMLMQLPPVMILVGGKKVRPGKDEAN